MIIQKKDRKEVYKYLFQEGVLYAEKNFQLEKHPEVEVPNLYIITLMKSFKSRGYVTERFAWRHYYWFLTIEGIKYLREYLNLPSDTNIVPATHKRTTRPERRPATGGRFGEEGGAREGGYREGYRAGPREGGPAFESEKGVAPSDYQPQYGGGFGRGGGYGRGRGAAP